MPKGSSVAAVRPEGAATLQHLDERLGAAIRARRTDGGVALARLATHPGSWVTQVALPTAAVVAALRGGSRRMAVFTAASVLGTSAIFHTVKHLTQRERPHADLHLVRCNDSSFPSGHAATAAAAARVLAEVAGGPRLPFAVAAVGIGTTRIYLGVHHPSDVVGGFLIGWCWAALMARLILAPEAQVADSVEPLVGRPDSEDGSGAADSWSDIAAQQAADGGHPCVP